MRPSNERDFQHEPVGKYNRAYQLGKLTLECTANDTERFNPRPTVTSRILALTWTAIFDAWSRYDDHAMPFYIDSVERRPPAERTLENKEIAITYAAYRTMLAYYFKDSLLLRKQMLNFGLDPDDDTAPATLRPRARPSMLSACIWYPPSTREKPAISAVSVNVGK